MTNGPAVDLLKISWLMVNSTQHFSQSSRQITFILVQNELLCRTCNLPLLFNCVLLESSHLNLKSSKWNNELPFCQGGHETLPEKCQCYFMSKIVLSSLVTSTAHGHYWPRAHMSKCSVEKKAKKGTKFLAFALFTFFSVCAENSICTHGSQGSRF